MIQNSFLSSLQCLWVFVFYVVFAKIFVVLSSVDGSVCTRTFQMVLWVSFGIFLGFALRFFGFFSVFVLVFWGYLVDSFGFGFWILFG